MSSVAIWYRVVDQFNPLCGCDVLIEDEGAEGFCVVTAIRRMDVLTGNRPYQLRAADGQNLGVSVFGEHLVESPIQDDVVEIAYDYPNGKCLDEHVYDTGDGGELRVAVYERAIQMAYGDQDTGVLHATCTIRGEARDERSRAVIDIFNDTQNFDYDALVARMKQENH